MFKVKRLPDGSVDHYKGLVVVQGSSQVQDIHYNEVFVPTPPMVAVCSVIVIAAMPAPPTPYVGILGELRPLMISISFRDYVVIHIHILWPRVVRRKGAHSEMETTELDSTSHRTEQVVASSIILHSIKAWFIYSSHQFHT